MKDVALPTARDCMSSRVLTFSPEQELFEAIAQLLKHHFAAAPVIDEEGRLTGMLTEKDCLRVLSNFTYEQDFEGGTVTVKDYQSPIRITCDPDMDVFRVTERFLACNFPLLPVVEDDRLVGVISRRDTLRGVEKLRESISRTKQQFESSAGHQIDRPRSIESLQRAAAGSSPEQLVGLMGRKS
jgi:CBS domain-containing protein